MTDQTKEDVQKIHNLKNKILKSNDKSEIISYLNEVIGLAILTPSKVIGPFVNTGYYQESKRRAISMLQQDLRLIEDGSYYDFELIHFQSASSILMFLLTIVDGGVSEIDRIINELNQESAKNAYS